MRQEHGRRQSRCKAPRVTEPVVLRPAKAGGALKKNGDRCTFLSVLNHRLTSNRCFLTICRFEGHRSLFRLCGFLQRLSHRL